MIQIRKNLRTAKKAAWFAALLLLFTSTIATANINVEVRTTTPGVAPNATVNVGLYLVSDNATTQYSIAADIMFGWDNTHLQLLGLSNAGAYPVTAAGFPNDNGNVNEVIPPQDGTGFFQMLVIGSPVPATPAGTLITTFQFKALSTACTGTPVTILPSTGNPSRLTKVYDGFIPNLPVTGTLGSTTIYIDGISPTITTCAPPQTVAAGANCQAPLPDLTATVLASDNCTSLTITQLPIPGTIVGLGLTPITLKVTDVAGNFITCLSSVTVTDQTPPSISTCSGNQIASANAGCQAPVPNFTSGIVASDNCTASGNLVITQSPTIGTLVGLGPHPITITVKDQANNMATCGATFTVNDTALPTISGCPANIGPVNTDPGQPTAVVNWTVPTASDNCSLQSFTSNHNPGEAFPVGVTSVTYTATDGSANVSTCVFTITVVDNQPPMIQNCPSTITQNADTGLCSTTVTWTAPTVTDNVPGATISQIQGPPPGSLFPVGTTTIKYKAQDLASNVAFCQFDVIVVDNQDPVIQGCPANIAIGTDSGLCSAVVSWTAPTAMDNCAIQTFTTTHNPGEAFPQGVTAVTYTATDVNGRHASCMFTVTVTDDDAPTITTCPGNQQASADANCQAAVPDFTLGVVASDNCTPAGSLIIAQSPTAGTLVGLGAHPITITVQDQAGNPATCGTNFTVNDTTPPTILGCPANITTNANTSSCAAIVTWTPPTAIDNCGGATILQTSGPPSGSTFANGTMTTIQYTATDAANNSIVCSFAVTVTASPDMNDDHVVDLADVSIFANVLVGLDTTPYRIARADVNCDGLVNGNDIRPFLSILVP